MKIMNNLFRDPSSKFEIRTALMIVFPPFAAFLFVSYTMFLMMDIIYAFFRANGYLKSEALREAFYEYIIGGTIDYSIYAIIFFILVFISGYYLSYLTLRPIRSIEKYCDKALTDKNVHFKTDIMANLNTLVSFSITFFQYMESLQNGSAKYEPQYLQKKYTTIKGPRFNLVFFIHYTFFLLLIAFGSYYSLSFLTIDIYEKISELAVKTLSSPTSELTEFLEFQKVILKSILNTSVTLICFTYAVMGFSFCKRLNGVIYRFIDAMRRIMKGENSIRISLRRDDPGNSTADSFNKYMDHVLPKS